MAESGSNKQIGGRSGGRLALRNEKNAIERKGINSVEIGLRVLGALAQAGEALALKDISRKSDLSPSQAHRYLTSLARREMVIQDPISGRYDLGPMALNIGLAALNRLEPIREAEEALDALVRRLDETAMLAIWGERGPIAIRWRRGRSLVFANVGLGTTFPLLSSTTGRLFLAYMPSAVTKLIVRDELKQLSKRNPDSEPPDIAKMIEDIRRDGFVSLTGHLVPGVWAACAPVLDSQANLVAGITVIGGVNDSDEHRKNVTNALIRAVAATSERLGHINPHQ